MPLSRVELFEIPSHVVDNAVPLGVILPPDFDKADTPLPLCIFLHGGGGDRSMAVEMQPLFDTLWETGTMMPMVIVSASTGPLSWYAGAWEEYIANELPTVMENNFNTRTDAGGVVLTGISMGGFGTLKIGCRRPERFAAIAAVEPAIEPGLRRADANPRNTYYRFPEKDRELYGDPVDEELWQRDNPANIAVAHADMIRSSPMEIYLEVGDEDDLNLHDGAEFMHRLMWDLDIPHEYHCVRWAGHVGPSLGTRFREAFVFLSNALGGGLSAEKPITPTAEEQEWLAWMNGGMIGEGPKVDLNSPRGPGLLDLVFRDKSEAARRVDPSCGRAYAQLPKSV